MGILISIILSCYLGSSSKEEPIKLISEVQFKSKKIDFFYTIKNNTNKRLAVNVWSYGNNGFLDLSLFKDGELKEPRCERIKANYEEILEDKSLYLIIEPNSEVRRKYKLSGCEKSFLTKSNLGSGTFYAVFSYGIDLSERNGLGCYSDVRLDSLDRIYSTRTEFKIP